MKYIFQMIDDEIAEKSVSQVAVFSASDIQDIEAAVLYAGTSQYMQTRDKQRTIDDLVYKLATARRNLIRAETDFKATAD